MDSVFLFVKQRALQWRHTLTRGPGTGMPAASHAPTSFTARLTPDTLDGGWVAECLELPGCMSQGETKEEALRNLIDAIVDVMAVRMASHMPRLPDDATRTVQSREEIALCV